MKRGRVLVVIVALAVVITAVLLVFRPGRPSPEEERALAVLDTIAGELNSIPRAEGLDAAMVMQSHGGCADSSIGEEAGGPSASAALSGDARTVVSDYVAELQRRGWVPVSAGGELVAKSVDPDGYEATVSRTIDGFEVSVRVSAGTLDLGFPGTTLRVVDIHSSINHNFC